MYNFNAIAVYAVHAKPTRFLNCSTQIVHLALFLFNSSLQVKLNGHLNFNFDQEHGINSVEVCTALPIFRRRNLVSLDVVTTSTT